MSWLPDKTQSLETNQDTYSNDDRKCHYPCLRFSQSHNGVTAFLEGAKESIPIMVAIIVVLIAFIAILAFFNTVMTWLGDRAGIEGLTLQVIMKYILSF